MAEFQSSISSQVANCQIFIFDNTDFTNDTLGHSASNFGFMFIEVTRPVDGDVYRFYTGASNNGSGDQLIDAPSVDPNIDLQVPTSWTLLNGEYQIRAVHVPTFSSAVNYAEGVVVFYSNKFYKSISAMTAPLDSPNIDTDNWVEITLEDILSDDDFSKYRSSVIAGINCIVENTICFESTLQDSSSSDDILLSQQAGSLAIVIHSNFIQNDENGHALNEFENYRLIKITKPDGSSYIMSSLGGDPDQVIAPPSSGNTLLNYIFLTTDIDGVWTIDMWEYPTWQTEVYYNSLTPSRIVVVYHNEKLWKLKQASLNNQPQAGSAYWEEFTAKDDFSRYYYSAKIGVRHIKLVPEYDKLVAASACSIIHNPCDDQAICRDKNFMRVMKMNVLMHAFEMAMCHRDFNRAAQYASAALQLACGC